MKGTIQELISKGYIIYTSGRVDIGGACNECLLGQDGKLKRPFGQGHHACHVVPEEIRKMISSENLFTIFRDGRWEVHIS